MTTENKMDSLISAGSGKEDEFRFYFCRKAFDQSRNMNRYEAFYQKKSLGFFDTQREAEKAYLTKFRSENKMYRR